MGIITSTQRKYIRNCISFIEAEYDHMTNHKGDTTFQYRLPNEKLECWKRFYYPTLIQQDILVDDRFFYPAGNMPNYGVGNDGIMRVADFCNLMYQLYKSLSYTIQIEDTEDIMIRDCIRMLEPYLGYYVNHVEINQVRILSQEHMNRWKNTYYPALVQTGKIPDNVFFETSGQNKDYGIGADGAFSGTELLHFLYECYKYLDVKKNDLKIPELNITICDNKEIDYPATPIIKQVEFSWSEVPYALETILIITKNGEVFRKLKPSQISSYKTSFLDPGIYEAHLECTYKCGIHKSKTQKFTLSTPDTLHAAKDYIHQAMKEFKTYIDLQAYQIDEADAIDIVASYGCTFHVDYIIFDDIPSSGRSLDIVYNLNQNEYNTFFLYLQDVANSITHGKVLTDLEKIVILYDWFVSLSNIIYENNFKATDAYGALWLRKGVCDGFARGFQFLCELMGICCIKGGSSANSHAWNAVEIEGEWYFLDTTWELSADKTNRHTYFLLSTDKLEEIYQIKASEFKSGKYNFPPCTNTKYTSGHPFNNSSGLTFYYNGENFLYQKDGNCNYISSLDSEYILLNSKSGNALEQAVPHISYVWISIPQKGTINDDFIIATGACYCNKRADNDAGFSASFLATIKDDKDTIIQTKQLSMYEYETIKFSNPGTYTLTVSCTVNTPKRYCESNSIYIKVDA